MKLSKWEYLIREIAWCLCKAKIVLKPNNQYVSDIRYLLICCMAIKSIYLLLIKVKYLSIVERVYLLT